MTTDQFHGRALAHMKLERWEVALEDIGRTEEAKAAGELAAAEPTPCGVSIYAEFHDKLKKLRRK